MLLNELVDIFLADYKFQCAIKNLQQINFPSKYIAVILSRAISDLQKKLGIIEASNSYTSTVGTATIDISASFMSPKVVMYGNVPLEKVTTEWIESQYPQSGTPGVYAIKYANNVPQLYLYPTPNNTGDTIVLTSNLNYNLYSPSASSQDFGTFDGNVFSGNTVFPTQYDNAILLGMMKQVFDKKQFPEFEIDFEKEWHLLRVKQYNGEKFTYELGNVIEERKMPLSYSEGVTTLLEDAPVRTARFTAVYGSQPVIDFSSGWSGSISAVDNGTTIVITSGGGDFAPGMIVTLNQPGISYQWNSINQITVYSGTNYGTLAIKLDVYS